LVVFDDAVNGDAKARLLFIENRRNVHPLSGPNDRRTPGQIRGRAVKRVGNDSTSKSLIWYRATVKLSGRYGCPGLSNAPTEIGIVLAITASVARVAWATRANATRRGVIFCRLVTCPSWPLLQPAESS
jgi:hypothetical protein